MADQTVKIERDDIASVTEELARSLWIAEFNQSPKASDEKFLQLVCLCNLALNGRSSLESLGINVAKLFPKPR